MLRVTSCFTGKVPKELGSPEANEDAIQLALEAGRIAVCDGASESFDSKTWARLLTDRFVRRPRVSAKWLAQATAEYAARFDPTALSWSKQAAFDRGSFATLLGVELLPDKGQIRVLGVGDSVAVLIEAGSRVQSFPYARAEQFQERPVLLATNDRLNTTFASRSYFRKHRTTWSLEGRNKPILLCMTDALGQWAMSREEEGNPVWNLIANIGNEPELEELVLRERQARAMRTDDTTLVRVCFETQGEDELPEP